MLLFRSISLQVFLLLLVHISFAQEEYGSDYEENSEYNSEDGEEHGHPDYSKYYSVDGTPAESSALTGFVGGTGFSSFFNTQPIELSGTNKKPLTLPPINFVPQQQQTQSLPIFSPIQQATNYHLSAPLKDFFEESQRKQQLQYQNKDDYIKPGPSYISHQLPLSVAATANADEVERIPPRPNKPKAKPKKESDDEIDEIYKDDVEVEKEIAVKNDKYLDLLNTKPYVDYNTGKSSSTISQYPLAAGLLDVSSSKLTPYQKYSFQPVVQASRITDDLYNPKTVEPFNPSYQKKLEANINLESQPSENVPSHLKDHDCRKISKSDSDMNCFVCVNSDTKSKYTQCSYTSEKEPVQYNKGYSERYSVPAKDGHFRYRRYTDRKNDPYYSIRERSRKTFEEPSIPENYNAGFQYEPENYEESNQEESYSEQQSENIKKNPQNCKKVEKEGSTCTVCRDPKTGGNYEQCSYSSAPSEKKYAYVKERKYNSDDEPEESKSVPKTENAPKDKIETSETKTEEKPVKDIEPIEKYEEQIDQHKTPKKRNDDNDPIIFENYKKNRDSSRARYAKEKYEVPVHFAESVLKETRDTHPEDESSSKDFDEYHLKLFPELSREESRKDETKDERAEEEEEEEYVIPESTKHNVEEVLAEFTKKDRSNCKKSEKNGMTCFLCVDKNKIQHEECMFIQESRPKSSHVAYHQLKGIKKLDNEEEQPDESKNKPILTEAEKTEFLKKPQIPETLEVAASEGVERRVAYKEHKDVYKKKRSPKKYKKKPVAEPTLKTPTEFEVGDEEGAFSAETKPVHSKLHGVQLPKYMVEKSEYEQEFDDFAGAH
ncbi:uncharacterized protein LOC126885952 [Diabrotica virgifera virgifera]|uniref:Uncharacterized protein n=1 Tax=Diabrotica virgifera virgifera TaxID=50390 RepID=A0ABM5KEV5_DIAVI|nr:uncharacterized protein LOC126885952 [Diabrotica virgifera virgifera]